VRRTPTLTKQARDIFEAHFTATGRKLYSFDEEYEVTGLTGEQVRDAIWAPSADKWRREMLTRLRRKQEAEW
jgi:hypothetical protein